MTSGYADVWPREGKSSKKNLLTVELVGVRRAYVYFRPSKDTRGAQDGPIPWKLSAFGRVQSPERAFPEIHDPTQLEVTLTPSVVDLRPLGGSFQLVAAAFLPPLPVFTSISFYFSADPGVPTGKSWAWAFADTQDTDFMGLFVAPFGYGPQLAAAPFVPPEARAPRLEPFSR
jgi:hypothetical protein